MTEKVRVVLTAEVFGPTGSLTFSIHDMEIRSALIGDDLRPAGAVELAVRAVADRVVTAFEDRYPR